MTSKLPYIPLYVGDWVKDTNIISIEAEGALIRLTFKLWNSSTRGRVIYSLRQLTILFKKSEKETNDIISELKEADVLNIEFHEHGMVKIESRRMLKAAAISATNSQNASKKSNIKKQHQSEFKAKHQRIHVNDSDIDNDVEYDNDVVSEVEVWPTFDDFWDSYDKKVGRDKSEKKWAALDQASKEAIMNHIPNYIASQPEKKYRKNPETYLNNKSWNDEIITTNTQQPGQQSTFRPGLLSEIYRQSNGGQ